MAEGTEPTEEQRAVSGDGVDERTSESGSESASGAGPDPGPGPAPGGNDYREMLPRILALTVCDGKVCALWDIANPDKFTGSPLKPDRAG